MQFTYLSETVNVKTVSEDGRKGIFEIEGLFAGYGLTIGNALRRTLLSSLPGAAVTEAKIRNVSHEFSTLPGIKEDIIEFSLNLKKLRFRLHTDEPQVLALKSKGEKTVTASLIKTNANVEIINPEEEIAHLTQKDAELDVEIRVERGLGYSPIESRKTEGRLPIGTIAIDALFTPVLKANYTVENMRVGDRTDYNRLRLEIETDGTISPSSALHKAANILKDHFEKVSAVAVEEPQPSRFESGEGEPKKKSRASKKKE
ncbi:DNA-directed RNA polymerase subunit alpha [Candidatus Parcubacteria bacterium]|nr:MAG: DNA-directed RNA polymerase subunit alpha [Candidatus Parcubacteria bacterium]